MKNLKKIITVLFAITANLAFACDACKTQQPKITQNLTHGTGPGGMADWIIVAVIAVVTVFTFIYTVKFLAKPGEKNKDHIKYSFLE